MTGGARRAVREFLEHVPPWAATRTDIEAIVLVGSHARGAATETSDVDLVIVTADPDRYFKDIGWAGHFGAVVGHRVEHYGALDSLRVSYADSLEVEYGVTDERWAAAPLDRGTRAVLAAGFRMLFARGPHSRLYETLAIALSGGGGGVPD